MARQDYLPRTDDAIIAWARNLDAKVQAQGARLGYSADEIAAIRASLAAIIAAITASQDAQRAALEAASNKRTAMRDALGKLRPAIARGKTSPTYTEGLGLDWGIVGPESTFDPHTYKPTLEAHVHPGHIELRFQKLGVDGLNIYARPRGTEAWTKLAYDTQSPYMDTRPAAAAEVREYAAIGVVDDEEVGLMSDVLSVAYGG